MFNCNKFFNAMVVLIILSSTCYAKDSISGVDGQTLLDACRIKSRLTAKRSVRVISLRLKIQ